MSFVTFTRRTNYPKLGWLMDQLNDHGIECKLKGKSFHAPILVVKEQDLDSAWDILYQVDDMEDDDEMFSEYPSEDDWEEM